MSEKKTILIGMGKPTGPVPVHFMALANELSIRGHEVHILMHCRVPYPESNSGPKIHFWKWQPENKFASILDLMFAYKMAKKLKPDCLISGHRDTAGLMIVGAILNIPVRVIWHHTLTTQIDIDNKGSRIKLFIGRLIRIPFYSYICTNVVGVSRAAVENMRNVYKVPSKNLKVLYNTLLNPSLIQTKVDYKVSVAPEERIFCVGRLYESKGQDIVIKAVSYLINEFPKITITFIGDGPNLNKLIELANELNVGKNVNFIGLIDHENVLKNLASASISLIPSRMDNLPTTAIESLGFGVPVIGTLAGGIPEIVSDGVDGFLIEPDNISQLVEKIRFLLIDTQSRIQMGRNARENFLMKFEQNQGVKIQADWVEELFAR